MKISYLKVWRMLRQLGLRPVLLWRNRDMTMTPYPSALPLDCFRVVVSNIRAKTVVENKSEFAHCLWNVQGYAQSMLLGPGGPDHAVFGTTPKPDPTEDVNLREVANALQDFQAEMAVDESFASAMAEAPSKEHGSFLIVIAQLIPAVLQLLIKLGVIKTAGDAPRMGMRHSPPKSEDDEPEAKKKK